MATASPPESPNPPDDSDPSASGSDSDSGATAKEPCKHYNKGHCRDGDACLYWHVCKFALSGNCKYGAQCKLKHPEGRGGGRGGRARGGQDSPPAPKLSDGRLYQWQLNDGSAWKDVENDHVIEAQFCLPHSKGIKLYNTEYGAVCIDFTRLRVRGKPLRVRRLDDGGSEWAWYCTLKRKWIKYGHQDGDGNPPTVRSSDIEQKFQTNPSGSLTFNIGAKTYEIKFREMKQVSSGRKRNVVRRPLFRQQAARGAGAPQAARGHQNMSAGPRAQWQFQGDNGAWHDFKSDDIERTYQQNRNGTMPLKANGNSYELNFGAMTQTNCKTRRTRKIRRN